MDPLTLWWIAPVALAGGGAVWAGVRLRSRMRYRPDRPMSRGAARRLALDAALHDLQQAQDASARARAEVQAAQAEVLRAQAQSPPLPAAVAGSRRRLQVAQREVKASLAAVRARRASVKVARATAPAWNAAAETLPLATLMAEHDALRGRWMAYETDPALAISYPSMSDAQAPALAGFLRAERLAAQLRPSSSDARTTPAAFAAYRDAVRDARHAFDAAEFDARRRAGEPTGTPGDAWAGVAQDLADGAQRAFWSGIDAIRERTRRQPPRSERRPRA
ncbi:hypothetical protein [Microbacterium sp. CJ88]|uniref:hypothetical protein n=1 Tax=Microbacterium sp. CJ88 TaxID=3445672 RepID=UPI003F6556E0